MLQFGEILTPKHVGMLVSGVQITVGMFLCSLAISVVLALVLLLARMAPVAILKWFVVAYIEITRNIPMLVQMMFWYFAVPQLLPAPAREWVNTGNSEFVLATLALGCCLASYMSEALRAGVRSVPKTQYEAGRSLGLGYLAAMTYIVLPQGFRASLPILTDVAVLLFKNTSIAVAIGVSELTAVAQTMQSETFRTFEIFAMVTILYIALSSLIMLAGRVAAHILRQR